MADAAKQFLQQVKLLDAHINSKLEELSRMKALRLKVTSTLKSDVVFGSGSKDKLGSMTAKILDLENELDAEIDALHEKKKEVSRLIEKIRNPDYVSILKKKYFFGESRRQIAYELNMSEKSVQEKHKKALAVVEKLLEGTEYGKE